MAMAVGTTAEGEPLSEINTTPLIDVMLVLLIMLIVTLPVQNHAVKLDTPVPPPPNTPPPEDPVEPIRLFVDFDGSIFWNGVVVDNATLQADLATESRRDRQPEIHIEPHRLAKYGVVAHVMASAQREGLTKLGVIGGT
ncbi:MAG: biopolymer transporter ExbD [Hyphomonadaceae bacterium]|nr:biopolymer transporter ExbD [Hyphomonadaceae bacterium]